MKLRASVDGDTEVDEDVYVGVVAYIELIECGCTHS